MKDYNSIITPHSISIILNTGKSFHVATSEPAYKAVAELLRTGRATAARLTDLLDVKQRISRATEAFGDFAVTATDVLYKGEPLRMPIAQRIVEIADQGFPVDGVINFLANLLQNPRASAVNELYGFLENSGLPLTDDGHFIAYKIVRNNYRDLFSGKFDNSIGAKPQMLRSAVDDDRNQTCSTGLHVCSKGYLPHFGTAWPITENDGGRKDRIIIVKVNPANVVAVPMDYNDAKMRVWTYEVIGEITDQAEIDSIEGSGLYRSGPFRKENEEHNCAVDACEDDDAPDYSYYGDDDADDEEHGEKMASGRALATQLFVKDEFDDTYYPASINDVRDGDEDLYIFDVSSRTYQLVK